MNSNVRYAITGHTSGIGKKLYEMLNPEVVGFSRTNGFDITKIKDVKKICELVNNCDIFINNACDGYGQINMFIELFRRWQHTNKTIINVGSRISEIVLPADRLNLLEYQSSKLALKSITDASKKIEGTTCIVKYKWFGYVGTEKILSKYPNFTVNDYISVTEACKIILS